jgi:glycosyltransferase involved in cell wall biosynthesis
MKVLLVSAHDLSGGAALAAYRLHDALNAAGMDCRMRVLHKGSDAPTVDAKHSWRAFIANRILHRLIRQQLKRVLDSTNKNLRSLAICGCGLVDEINKSDADIVNLHWISHEMFSIRDLARITKPVVWTLHDMWAFCGAEHVCDDGEDARWRTGYTKENRPSEDSGLDVDRWTWERKCKYWTRPMHMAVPSTWMADCLQGSKLMAGWPVEVLPTPINLKVYCPWPKDVARQMFGLPVDVPLILFGAWCGGASSNKGGDLLLQALPNVAGKVPEVRAVVFGGGRFKGDEENSSMPIHTVGALLDEYSLALLYSAADVMVVPSRVESLCQTALEAQACGTPVVCFDKTGLIDSVDDGKTGLRVTPYSVEELSAAIIRLLLDEDLRNSMGAAGPEHVAKLCGSESVASRYRSVFESAIASRVI